MCGIIIVADWISWQVAMEKHSVCQAWVRKNIISVLKKIAVRQKVTSNILIGNAQQITEITQWLLQDHIEAQHGGKRAH